MGMERLLQVWGYETCESASSAEESIKRVEKDNPDVVLMDINTQSGMDGIEAAGIIIKRFSVSVILITGYDDEDFYRRARNINTAGYFVKPIELGELHAAIASLPE